MFRSAVSSPPNLRTETIIQTDIQTYQVTSMTNKSKHYEVTILDKDIASCQCGDFEYRMRQCKHIAEVFLRVFGEI